MITPEQKQKINEFLKGSNYTPPESPTKSSGSSWYDAVQSKISEVPAPEIKTQEAVEVDNQWLEDFS